VSPKQRLVISVIAVPLCACSTGPVSLVNYSASPSVADTAGCTSEQLHEQWSAHRYGSVQVGDDLCTVIGKWGQPYALSTFENATATTLIAEWSRLHGNPVPYNLTLSATQLHASTEPDRESAQFRVDRVRRLPR